MLRNTSVFILPLLVLVLLCSWNLGDLDENQASLTIHVKNIRNHDGVLRFYLYTRQEDFEKEEPYGERQADKIKMQDGEMLVTFTDIPPGRYGIVAIDDENNNADMDYGWFLPSEGFGFTNYYHRGMKKPKLELFSFELDGVDTVEMIFKYM